METLKNEVKEAQRKLEEEVKTTIRELGKNKEENSYVLELMNNDESNLQKLVQTKINDINYNLKTKDYKIATAKQCFDGYFTLQLQDHSSSSS